MSKYPALVDGGGFHLPAHPAAAVIVILYGLGCIALGALVMTAVFNGVPYAGLFEWGFFLGGAFMTWAGAMAFWWD